ncbi:hypothetical protein [Sorangium sp. So ce176]|uniref:hypothetical protein n=1 Tax=Sorangium sp. So ce176 TaxID=3133286 RepID=UPI003F5EFF2E
MRSLHRFFCLALPAAAAALSAGTGCGFPDVTFTGDASDPSAASAASAGGGTAGTTTSSASTGGAAPDASGAGGGGGAASSSAGAGGDGGSTASGAGGDGGAASSSAGAGGDGGAASSSATASSTATGSGGGGTVDCDADDDGYLSTACEGGNDCNDENPLVHPGQPSTFYETPISPGGSFDYDCSGAEEREFQAVECSNILPLCAAKSNVFLVDVPCGRRASFGNCNGTCQSMTIFPDYVRKCH